MSRNAFLVTKKKSYAYFFFRSQIKGKYTNFEFSFLVDLSSQNNFKIMKRDTNFSAIFNCNFWSIRVLSLICLFTSLKNFFFGVFLINYEKRHIFRLHLNSARNLPSSKLLKEKFALTSVHSKQFQELLHT
jgi:hypothetical protein